MKSTDIVYDMYGSEAPVSTLMLLSLMMMMMIIAYMQTQLRWQPPLRRGHRNGRCCYPTWALLTTVATSYTKIHFAVSYKAYLTPPNGFLI
ncbi:hypothetical protein CRM22_003430, partial [Opisthorchis felineus]